MKVAELIDRSLIHPDMAAGDKIAAIRELIGIAGKVLPALDCEQAVSVLLERENLGTTGIGEGIAIPHGKMETLDSIVLIIGRSIKGLDFDALDHKPCCIFFLVLAPEHVPGEHLRVLASISRLLKNEAFRESFMDAADVDALWELLSKA